MFNLRITNIDSLLDLHTLDVPYEGDNRRSAGTKENAKFRAARINMVNFKHGVQALGSSTNIVKFPAVTVTSREEAEEQLATGVIAKEDSIACVKVTPEDGEPFMLYASKVRNPEGVAQNRTKVNMPLTAQVTFDNFGAKANPVDCEEMVTEIMRSLTPDRNMDMRIEKDMAIFYVEARAKSDLFNSMSNMIRTMNYDLAGTKFEGVRANVRYV